MVNDVRKTQLIKFLFDIGQKSSVCKEVEVDVDIKTYVLQIQSNAIF